jgi:hypothetical protein
LTLKQVDTLCEVIGRIKDDKAVLSLAVGPKGSRAASIGAIKAAHNLGPYDFVFHAAKYEPPTFGL